MFSWFVDEQDPEYKAPLNQIGNVPRVFTPEDKAVQSANSDTPYSFLALDLRTEPIVLSVPVIEEGRYYSIQLIDLYTHNFDYIGSRTTGARVRPHGRRGLRARRVAAPLRIIGLPD